MNQFSLSKTSSKSNLTLLILEFFEGAFFKLFNWKNGLRDLKKKKMKENFYDPINNLKKKNIPIVVSEKHGLMISIIFESKKFLLYDVYNFLEKNLEIECEDISIFRDNEGNPTGIVIAIMKDVISQTLQLKLNQLKFKGKKLKSEIYFNINDFWDFIKYHSNIKNLEISIPYKSIPSLIIQNFNGDNNEFLIFFNNFGNILRIINQNDYKIIIYDTENSTINVYKNYNCYIYNNNEILINLLYYNSIERTFSVEFCNDLTQLKELILKYGQINEFKFKNNKYYFLMSNLENSKNACLLLNSRKINNKRIYTQFIPYQSYILL